ncbi:uncharacterized protein LOC105750594 isoform X2 [Sarcophilus harrisii]|uniref:uncharacterized protein LOC105750594 isoform X2 n=1 Tax=Sarcophilus harrisii TaxID=9305 RepID=UPI001301C9B4|nr:uncharacterized protein LOC105750594 isoform X2 [Sarcophilus harrisii]
MSVFNNQAQTKKEAGRLLFTMKWLFVTFALILIITGPKRVHREVQNNSSSNLSCLSCVKARNEDKEKRNAEEKIDGLLVSNLSGQHHLVPPFSWQDLKEEWNGPLSPIVLEEEIIPPNDSNGLLCPSCNALGTQQICNKEFKWRTHKNRSCLTIYRNTKMGDSYYDIIMKSCGTEEDCQGEIKTLYGFPFLIKEKICVNAKAIEESRGSILFSIPALLVILPWMLAFLSKLMTDHFSL